MSRGSGSTGGLGQVERRCTLALELEHLRRGDHGCQDEATESTVAAAAARYLLPDPHIVAEALVWARGDIETAADELWVDEPTLRARLDARHLHPAEHAIIVRRINALEVGRVSELEKQFLGVWRRWPHDHERDRRLNEYKALGLSGVRALQAVNRLLTDPVAWEHDPVSVARLRRLRNYRMRRAA